MCTKLYPKIYQVLSFFLALSFGLALISCKSAQYETETPVIQAQEAPISVEPPSTPLTPNVTVTVDSFPTVEPVEATPTAVSTLTKTTVITAPTLLNLDIPLATENLPEYAWFSEDSQMVYFAYPEEGVVFSYDIAAKQLGSTPLLQKSDNQVIEQIAVDLPSDARVVDISPKYQNVLYTIPISEPVRLVRGAFSVPLGYELWVYKGGQSSRLGAVDECFLININRGALWSPSETLATLNAFAPMACAWSNWLIDLEMFSVAPVDEIWAEGNSGFYIAAILPNKQLLLTPLLRREPSAVLDLQTGKITTFLVRGNEVARQYDVLVLLDFTFWYNRYESEVTFSPIHETDWQLIDTIEGSVRAKYVSPDQKQVLIFSGSSDYYGLSENQTTSGVWLLTFP